MRPVDLVGEFGGQANAVPPEADVDADYIWQQVYWAGVEAGFGKDVADWTHFQAVGAIELVLETYNFVSNSQALGVLRKRMFRTDWSDGDLDEDLFCDPNLLDVLRKELLAIYSLVGSVVGRLGGQSDDHHHVLRILDGIAREMGYECSGALQMEAPAKDVREMVEWAWREAMARDYLAYEPSAGLPN